MTLLLASGSPRRRALLEGAGIPLEVRPAAIDESRHPEHTPVAHAERLATEKAAASRAPADRVVLAADTVVHLEDRIFDKSADRALAAQHLRTLAGQTHQVTTGVCVARGPEREVFHVTTLVRLRALTPADIAAYLATGEADDKAGAYGIQGRAGSFVAEVHGSWTNVVGLPLEPTLAALARAGIRPRT